MEYEGGGDFTRPESVEWAVFEEAVVKVFYNWDMTEHALDDEWAGEHSEDNLERVLDYLLENFAERWLAGKVTHADSVAEFLSDTVKDHFEVDIPASLCFPLAKLMCTLYEECRAKVLVGVNTVLGEDVVKSFYEENRPLEGAAASAGGKMEVEGGEATKKPIAQQEEEEEEKPPKVDPDGWTTVEVKAKPAKKKAKGKKMD